MMVEKGLARKFDRWMKAQSMPSALMVQACRAQLTLRMLEQAHKDASEALMAQARADLLAFLRAWQDHAATTVAWR